MCNPDPKPSHPDPSAPIVILLLWVLAFGAALTTPSFAEAQVDIGVQAVYNVDLQIAGDDNGAAGIGGLLRLESLLGALGAQGKVNWYYPDCPLGSCNFWEIGAGPVFTTRGERVMRPEFGAGVVYQSSTVATSGGNVDSGDTGFDVFGGFLIEAGESSNAFARLGYRLMQDFDEQLVISAGLVF